MATSRQKPKKKRVVIARPVADKGDLQISRGEAKLRLTPKLFVALFLLVAASVSLVVIAARHSGRPSSANAPTAGQSQAVAAAPGINRPPLVTSAAVIPANPTAELPLDVKYEAADPDGDAVTCTFRWFVNDRLVQEGASSSLPPGSYRSGDAVCAEVVPADPYATGTTLRTQSVTIAMSPPTIAGVTIGPDRVSIGDVVTATPTAAASDPGPLAYHYQWYVNGEPSGSADAANTFDTRNLRKRDSIFVAVAASSGALKSKPVRSNMVFVQNRKPEIVSSAPDAMPGGRYMYQVVAKDPDGDVLKYRLEQAPAGMAINESSGLIQWALQKDTMYPGRNEAAVRVVVDDGDGGTASQDFTIVFTDLYVH